MSEGKLEQPSASEGKLVQPSVSEGKLAQPSVSEGKLRIPKKSPRAQIIAGNILERPQMIGMFSYACVCVFLLSWILLAVFAFAHLSFSSVCACVHLYRRTHCVDTLSV